MATAVFTTVEARVDQLLTNAIWKDEIQDNLNALAGSHRNLLTNGGMEVWQRGAGPFSASAAYTADRWQVNNGDGTHTTTQETSIVDAPSASALKCVFTRGTVDASIFQKMEDYLQLRGRTVSFSIRVRQSVASSVKAYVSDGTPSYSATSATTGSFVTLTVTATLSGAATLITCGVVMTASVTAYLDNAMLVIGPAPAPYQPLHPQEDLARCQRYYEVFGGANSTMLVQSYGAAGANNGVPLLFGVPKAVSPTITKNGTWSVTNCGQPTAAFVDTKSFHLGTTVTALGSFNFFCNSTDDTLTVESNP